MHFLDKANGTLVCGHRGHSAEGHENSMTSLSLAAQHGADLCEIDVRRTADGAMIVFHDDFLNTMSTGAGRVKDKSLDALLKLKHRLRGSGETDCKLLSLEDTLTYAFDLGLKLIIELKDAFESDEIDRLAAALDGHQYEVLVASFDHCQLKALRTAHPELRTLGIAHARLADPVSVAVSAALSALTLDYPDAALSGAAGLKKAGIASSHFVPDADCLDKNRKALLSELIFRNELNILYCKDVAWGRAFCDTTAAQV